MNIPFAPHTERLIAPESLTTSRWAGGTTTELLIAPAQATYASRDFIVRISTATVEQDGPFTPLPGVNRKLMIISGQARLAFSGGPIQEPAPFETLSFEGGNDVFCSVLKGPIRDFNVLLREGASASLRHVSCQPNSSATLNFQDALAAKPNQNSCLYFIYPIDSACQVEIPAKNISRAIRAGGAYALTLPINSEPGTIFCRNTEQQEMNVIAARVLI